MKIPSRPPKLSIKNVSTGLLISFIAIGVPAAIWTIYNTIQRIILNGIDMNFYSTINIIGAIVVISSLPLTILELARRLFQHRR